MTWLNIDGNVVEVVLLAAMVALLAAAYVIGRLDWLNRRRAEQRSVDALVTVRAEEEVRIDTLRKEKEGILSRAHRAEDALERWETVRRDHEQLEAMRRELEDFEREESRRVDELERQRVEAARRLAELRAMLDQYPPEIIWDEGTWKQRLDSRKAEYDQLQQTIEEAKKAFDEVDQRRTQAASEMESLERKANQLRDKIESLNDELSRKREILKKIDGVPPPLAAEKLSAFRIMPNCLEGYDKPHARMDEDDLLSEFEDALRNLGLQYPSRIIRAFHTALKVNDLSPLTVLSGLSGTGKSQLPRAYARFFGIHFLHVPVEPGWDSPQDLLGFYDFVAERYRPTDRARALGHFDHQFAKEIKVEENRDWDKRMLIILLDEMNLARTEYYFSEFLSRLEMRGTRESGDGDEASRRDAQIAIDLPYAEGEKPKHLYVPHNVIWIGTLNEDETTQTLSDKVLDRANSIRFAPPEPGTLREHSTAPQANIEPADGYLPYQQWLQWSERGTAIHAGAEQIDEALERLATAMQKAERGFGYRITQSIRAYIERYPGQDWRVPMIDQINMRLLPKLAGAQMSDCRETVDELRQLCGETLGDPAFEAALQKAATASEASLGFSWPGYTYAETSV